jgi:hypothetical protein
MERLVRLTREVVLWPGLRSSTVSVHLRRLISVTVPMIRFPAPFEVLTAKGLVFFGVRCLRIFECEVLAGGLDSDRWAGQRAIVHAVGIRRRGPYGFPSFLSFS